MDGLIYASSMVMFDSARRKVPVPGLARWLLGLGIAATIVANVAHGLGHGLIGAAVAAWSALALVSSHEFLMMIIRSAQVPGAATAPRSAPVASREVIRWRRRLRRNLRARSLPGACPRCVRSAPGYMSGSRVPSGCAYTWSRSTALGCPCGIRLPSQDHVLSVHEPPG